MRRKMLAILDHDLTLVNTLTYFFRSYNQARARFGHRPIRFREFLSRYADESLSNPPGTERLEFWLYFSSIFKTLPTEPVSPMPGATEIVEMLRESGFSIVVVTGRRVSSRIVLSELERAGLDGHVEAIHTLSAVSSARPFDKAALFSQLVSPAKLDACVSVGDYSEDIRSSAQIGCLPLGVAPFGKSPSTLYGAGAAFVGRDLREVKAFLEKSPLIASQ